MQQMNKVWKAKEMARIKAEQEKEAQLEKEAEQKLEEERQKAEEKAAENPNISTDKNPETSKTPKKPTKKKKKKKKKQKPNKNPIQKTMVGDGVDISDFVQGVADSIIGDRVTIGEGCLIKQCVILDEAVIEEK
jgi:ADP-glucose pyrophosphorylase